MTMSTHDETVRRLSADLFVAVDQMIATIKECWLSIPLESPRVLDATNRLQDARRAIHEYAKAVEDQP